MQPSSFVVYDTLQLVEYLYAQLGKSHKTLGEIVGKTTGNGDGTGSTAVAELKLQVRY